MRTPAQLRALTAVSEHDEQVKLVTLLLGPLIPDGKGGFVRSGSVHTHKWPELELLYAVPNGSNKSKAQAGMFRAEGLQSGVPDLCLPVARARHHGLYIEMKKIGGKSTPAQRSYATRLREEGYWVQECQGHEAALAVVLEYLEAGNVRREAIERGATAGSAGS